MLVCSVWSLPFLSLYPERSFPVTLELKSFASLSLLFSFPDQKKFKNSMTSLSDLSWQLFWGRHSGLKRILLPPFVVWIASPQQMTGGGTVVFFFPLHQTSLFCQHCISSCLSCSYLQQRMKLREKLTSVVALLKILKGVSKKKTNKNTGKLWTFKYSVVRCSASAWLLLDPFLVVFYLNTLLRYRCKCRGHFSSQFLGTCGLLHRMSPPIHCSCLHHQRAN